jgi:Excalibur calcium-binding domain
MLRYFAPLAAAALISIGFVAPASAATTPPRYQRCADLQQRFPHGVARPGASDATSGSRPVTTFAVNRTAYQANTHLDRDKDGVACEKR